MELRGYVGLEEEEEASSGGKRTPASELGKRGEDRNGQGGPMLCVGEEGC